MIVWVIEVGDVDAGLAASHQVIQCTGRTLLPEPYGNARFPLVKPLGLEETRREMLEDEAKHRVWQGGGIEITIRYVDSNSKEKILFSNS
jgi:hypothetical protein